MGVGGWGIGRDQGSAPAAMLLAGSFSKFISADSHHFSCTTVLQQLIVSFSASA